MGNIQIDEHADLGCPPGRSGDNGEDALLHSALDAAVANNAEASAINNGTERWSYSELQRQSFRFANWLIQLGVQRGDRVLVRLTNTREFAAILFGCSRIGAVMVPISTEMRQFHLRAVIGDADPRLVVTTDSDVPLMSQVTERPVHALSAVVEQMRKLPMTAPAVPTPAPNDLALLIYTSGSTALPKAVVCPHAQVAFAAHAIAAELGYQTDDVVLCRLPFSFDYGLYQLLLASIAGCEVFVPPADSPDLQLLQWIRRHGVTVVPIVPSLGQMLVRLAGRTSDQTSLRMITNTGAALNEDLIRQLQKAFPNVTIRLMFGITECKRVSILEGDGVLLRPTSVGRPLGGTSVTIVDDDDQPLPPGRTGQIVVRGPHVMAGYWNAPELTMQRFRLDRETGTVALYTGDYGYLDAEGYLYFAGRRDDLFKRRGTRVSVLEIEAAAVDIPGVRAAAVLPPTADGDLVMFVDAALTGPEVLREMSVRLEPAKVPSHCHVVASLPLTPNGKTDKKSLADHLLKGATS
ncbi:peptide synthetase [Actinoplanes sp. SE50]|uniref:class I adenylate-forming enzyme family protein n=1 Tax=unclassified Actinoplanes TaxID=2626549 RepID=UPI00023ECBB1|nr:MULTISPECIES: AMP-binding protein [unclassified Actinoplanes]AEV87129.1 Acetyl-coenzyme A synthetase [Actinoplanes sp. SE50/110]ATO85527.1 peptide synthetase [Actinoplanes sp. SE50]SLM02940.1 peptide synthetase [Actinoplanes sp. SE50/110]